MKGHYIFAFFAFAPLVAYLAARLAAAAPPRVLLHLMVRNEAKIIKRTIRSAISVLGVNQLFLCDTGSSDATIELARAEWADAASLHVWRTDFIDFETTRNACKNAMLNMTSDIDWVILGDADFEYHGQLIIPETDVNMITFIPNYNTRAMLVRWSALPTCEYKLWAHEVLVCAGSASTDQYPHFQVIDHADGSSRAVKIQRDSRLLKGWLQHVNSTEYRPRALYYLARTFEDAGNYTDAATVYAQHSREEIFTNYQFHGLYQMALLELRANKSDAVIERAFLRAYGSYDGYFRWEPLYYLARHFRLRGNYNRCIMYASSGAHLPPVNMTRMPLFLDWELRDKHIWEELEYCKRMKSMF